MTSSQNWKGWTRPEDVPPDLRAVIRQGELVPLLDPMEAATMRQTVLETFAEVLDTFLDEARLKWAVDHVHRSRPKMPMEAVFQAVSLEIGVSVSRLRTVWYVDRRKARVTEIVRQKLKEARS